jgi:hypothetical protein
VSCSCFNIPMVSSVHSGKSHANGNVPLTDSGLATRPCPAACLFAAASRRAALPLPFGLPLAAFEDGRCLPFFLVFLLFYFFTAGYYRLSCCCHFYSWWQWVVPKREGGRCW